MLPIQDKKLDQTEFKDRLGSIGDTLRKNVVSKRMGDSDLGSVDKVYNNFGNNAAATVNPSIAKASEDQLEVFKDLTEEMIRFRKDEKVDTDKFKKEILSVIQNINEKEGDDEFKKAVQKLAEEALKDVDRKESKFDAFLRKAFTADEKTKSSGLYKAIVGDSYKKVGAVENAVNEGKAEGEKDRLGELITGKKEDKKAASFVNGVVPASKNGAFPDKIANLSVENLIIDKTNDKNDYSDKNKIEPKDVRIKDVKHAVEKEKQNYSDLPRIDKEERKEGDVTPKETSIKKAVLDLALIEKEEHQKKSTEQKRDVISKVGKRIATPEMVQKSSIEPRKAMNPAAKLKTSQTAIAIAVKSMVSPRVAPNIKKPSILQMMKPTEVKSVVDTKPPEASTKTVSPQQISPDAVTPATDPVAPKPDTGLNPLDLLPIAAEAAIGARGAKPAVPTIDPKAPVSAASSLEKAASGVAQKSSVWGKIGGAAKAVGKVGGKLLGPVAATLLAAGSAYGEYKDVDEQVKAGTLDAGEGAKRKGGAVGGGLGSFIGGALGFAAGSVIPGPGNMIGSALGATAGDYVGNKIGSYFGTPSEQGMNVKSIENGAVVARESSVAKTEEKQSASAPIIINSSTSAPTQSSGPVIMPVQGNVRNRESYFDMSQKKIFVAS